MLKKNYRFIYLITCLSIFLMTLLASVQYWCFNESFYHNQHQKLELYGKSIAEYIGISDTQLDELTHFTLDYLKRSDTSLDKKMIINNIEKEVFNDDEKMHMVDVRTLNIISRYILLFSFLLSIISLFFIYKKKCFNDFYNYNKIFIIYLIIFISILGLWIMIDFDSFWNSFHHVFFASNDLWILDLSKDVLIMIVPPEFFNNLVIYILITFVLLYILVNILFYFVKRND